MSKKKQAHFHVRSHETVLKKGFMDYCITGGYSHFVSGDAILTDERFFFGAQLPEGDYLAIEFPLTEIFAVERIGVPFFTRSMLVTTDEKRYRFNAFFVIRWARALQRAMEKAKASS